MGRLSAVFIAFCMIVVAGAVGAVAYLSFDISGMEAFVIATAAMTVMVLINSTNGRTRDRSDAGAHIADLSRGTVDLARKVSEIERRLIALEGDVAVTLDEARTIATPLNEEIGELGSLVKDLADAVAAHDQMLDSALVSAPPARPAPAPASPLPPPSSERLFVTEPVDRGADLTEPESAPPPAAARTSNGPFRGLDQAEINARLARAVEANRIELFLQPIVTLPQRKVRYYEAQTRLRGDDGGLIATEDFYPHAAAAQLLPAIDNLMVFRCVQVVRRLSTKNREVGLFCALSADTFAHAKLFKDLTDFLEANRAIAPHLVFQFTQEALRGLGPIEEECVASLADLGFRFAIDGVSDLRMEPRELSERGFRFVKVPAPLLLSRAAAPHGDIHPADFADLLARFGIELIADTIESEGTVVDLLDYDVRFGQGTLFSPPRPVRTEVLQGMADRPAPPPSQRTAERSAPAETPPDPRLPSRATAIGQLARGIAARRAQG